MTPANCFVKTKNLSQNGYGSDIANEYHKSLIQRIRTLLSDGMIIYKNDHHAKSLMIFFVRKHATEKLPQDQSESSQTVS